MGVGFSRPDDPVLWANNLSEASIDFDKFLDGLFEIIPDLDDSGRQIHMVGESFAGHYIPQSASATRRKLTSVVLVDPYIDMAESALGIYDHCCVGENPHPGLNETACRAVEKGLGACKLQGDICRDTYDPILCEDAGEACFNSVMEWFDNGPEGRPTHSPFDDRIVCDRPERLGMCGGLGQDEVTSFLNSTEVKRVLGQPNTNYSAMNYDFNARWTRQPETNVPSTRELTRLLEDKQVPILVINGNGDIIGWVHYVDSIFLFGRTNFIASNSEGMVDILDHLPWTGNELYKKQKLASWWFNDSRGYRRRGGQFKQYGELALTLVDDAGHMNVVDQPQGTFQILKRWLSETSLEG